MSPKRTLLVLLASVSLAATALPAAAAASAIPTSYPRNETVYTTGTMWYPPGNFNPFNTLNTTGTIGLLYEPLFMYNPLTDKMVNWLAQSGTWTASNVYTVTLRQGIKWSDGTPLTADDVLYTVDLAKLPSVGDYGIWASSGTGGYLESVTKVDQYTVKFTFSKPAYQQWSNWLYSYPILPSVNWGTRDATSVLFANATSPVGSGPYTLLTYNSTEVVWQKNDSWWGESIGLNVTPKYVIDLADLSNNVTLSQMLAGGIDLSNNFLPGIASIVTGLAGQGGYSITTYYPKAPYMLSANTAWLVPNVTKKPTSDPVFRRALAESINVSQIVTNVYTNIVAAANPTGLLPVWSKYVNTSLVKQYGFTYNPAAAKALLKGAGYKMGSDGYFRNKDGSPINLSLIVPSGWTDWMAAIQSIAQSAKKAGIRITPGFPAQADRLSKMNATPPTFDLTIANDAAISNTPWTYYYWMFHTPFVANQGNYQHYFNATAWSLVQKLNATPSSNVSAMESIISQLQKIQLQNLPLIPLWYNGMWSQANNAVWTNWPSSAASSPHVPPVTWNGYWNMGAVLMLTQLKLAAAQ